MHGWRGWTYLPKSDADRAGQRAWVVALMRRAVAQGWIQSKAKNRWILFKDKLGRIQLFETGRLNLWIRKPATFGRAIQIIVNGLTQTGLITDLKELEVIIHGFKWRGGVRLKSQHYVFDTKQALPKMTIDFFAKSNGVIIKVGDRTHPTSVEVIASYPDWAERNERMLGDFMEVMTNLMSTIQPNKTIIKKPELGYVS